MGILNLNTKNTKMKAKFFGILALVLVAVIALTLVAKADVYTGNQTGTVDVKTMTVYVEGVMTWDGNCVYDSVSDTTTCTAANAGQLRTLALERGEQMAVKVVFVANNDLPKSEVKTWITGYRDDIEASSGTFDVFKGNTYTRTLYLDIPSDIDAKDTYTLYVQLEGKVSLTGVDEAEMSTVVQKQVDNLQILSVDLYGDSKLYKGVCGECTEKFQAGKICACTNGQLYADIVLKNRGNYDLEDVYVKIQVEGTCIERNVYVGDLVAVDSDDEDDSRKVTIALTLPGDMKSGTYTLNIEAYNDDESATATESFSVEQVQPEQPVVVSHNIQVLPQLSKVDVEQGAGSAYTLTVTNLGSERENVIVEVLGTEGWATSQVNPAAFSLANGESKQVFVYLNANEDAVMAEHTFTVNVRYGDQMKQLSLTSNVTEAKAAALDLKAILLIVGIVLAVVIVVLLIIFLAKGQGRAEEKPEESYY